MIIYIYIHTHIFILGCYMPGIFSLYVNQSSLEALPIYTQLCMMHWALEVQSLPKMGIKGMSLPKNTQVWIQLSVTIRKLQLPCFNHGIWKRNTCTHFRKSLWNHLPFLLSSYLPDPISHQGLSINITIIYLFSLCPHCHSP